MKTHRELYPEQYTHPLCGKLVCTQGGYEFVVERVVNSRYGLIAIDPNGPKIGGFLAESLTPVG